MDDKTDNCCDELLAMAKEAGISESQFMPGYIHATMANVERFHALAVAPYKDDAERYRYIRSKKAAPCDYDTAIDRARSAK